MKIQQLNPLYSLSLIVAIILPLVIWRLKLPIVQATYPYEGRPPGTLESQPFELFGFFITIVLVATTWLKFIQQPRRNLATVVPIVLPLLVCLNLLFIQVETFQVRSSDFMCYENAARSILAGSNPYIGTPSCYVYPPLLAQVLASLHQIATYNPLFGFIDEDKAWTTVTYFYQSGKFLQVILAYHLTSLLAQNLKIKALPASLLVAALFQFNYPLVRTLTWDQANLWILNSFLLGILLLRRYPFLGGLAVALGAHIKLYTLVLLFPWVITKRWKAILGMLLGFVAIVIIQTGWAHDWTLWQQFSNYFKNPERPSNFRNNAVKSLIANLFKMPSLFLGTDGLFKIVTIIVFALVTLLILIWFVLRFIQRERIYKNLTEVNEENQNNSLNDVFRFYGHSMDAIALALLISPSVWEHHFVIVIPIAVWAIATRRFDKPLLVCIGTFLIFCIPTFEIFPLSFHRLAGLLILVWLTTPESIRKAALLRSGEMYCQPLEDKIFSIETGPSR